MRSALEVLASIVPRMPAVILLGTNKVATWYNTNKHFRFAVGDVLEIKGHTNIGYGTAPRCRVLGHGWGIGRDIYYVEIESLDTTSAEHVNWLKTGEIPKDAETKKKSVNVLY